MVAPSDQTTIQGAVPVRAAWMLVLMPEQIVPPPLTVAVGRGALVTVFAQVLEQPFESVMLLVSVKVADAPAVTLTVWALVAPAIEPLPLIDQR